MGITTDPGAADTFPQFIRAAAAAYRDQAAIILKGKTLPDESITFSELDRQSAELAKGLIARGVGKGNACRIHLRQRPVFRPDAGGDLPDRRHRDSYQHPDQVQ